MAEGLIVVADSSAWIAAYRPVSSLVKDMMFDVVSNHIVLVPDLVLVEILRGIRTEEKAIEIEADFKSFEIVHVVGKHLALMAARNYRTLRSKGITIRGTVDLMIATWCIENKVPLLHADRDFIGFEQYLGLKSWPISI